MQNFMLNLFKNIIKKIKYCKSSPSCNWGVFLLFFVLIDSKGKIFKTDRKIVNYWWAGVSNCSTIFMITKIYIFLVLYFTLVLLLIMRGQSASIERTAISTAAFYHCCSYTGHSDLWIGCDIFFINIVCRYEICEFIGFLIC